MPRWASTAVLAAVLCVSACSSTSGTSGASGSAGAGGDSGASGAGTGGSVQDGGSGAGGSSGVSGCGPTGDAALLLYTTLDDDAAIRNPATIQNNDATDYAGQFAAGKCGGALGVATAEDFLQFAESGNIDYSKGTLDFWIWPDFDKVTAEPRPIFKSSAAANTGPAIYVFKASATYDNSFNVDFTSASGEPLRTAVGGSFYALPRQDWTRITITWDFTETAADASKVGLVRVYFNGVESQYQGHVSGGPYTMTPTADNGRLYVGELTPFGQSFSVAAFDDLKIYASAVEP